MLSEGRREGLRLSLSRSLSSTPPLAPSLAPSSSLPSSPLSTSTALHRSLLLRRVKTLEPSDVARRLAKGRQRPALLLLDLRPFLHYNRRHIRSAVNLNVSDRLGRKRLLMRRQTSLTELAGRRFRDVRDVLVYDEGTMEAEDLPPDHPVLLVLAAALEDGRTPLLLRGGFTSFSALHPELCAEALRPSAPSPPSSLPPFLCPSARTALLPLTPEEGAIERAPLTRVLPHLYLGNARDAQDLPLLESHGIRRVLTVSCRPPSIPAPLLAKTLPALDTPLQDIAKYFPEAIAFIDCCRYSSERVLVHCHAGISRSATVVIAYLMHARREPMIDAYRAVKTLRPIISPNLNFMGQLVEWEATLRTGGPAVPPCAPCHQVHWTEQAPPLGQVPAPCQL